MNILVIEDDADVARYFQLGLEADRDTDMKVQSVRTVREALEALESLHYDAIVLDLVLPNGKGRAVIDRVERAAPRTPMVVVTACADVTPAEAIMAGAQEYLPKPVTVPQLKEGIGMAVARHKVRSDFSALPRLEKTLEEMKTLAAEAKP